MAGISGGGAGNRGVVLAGVQFFFTLGWTTYVVMLPGLLATAGIAASWQIDAEAALTAYLWSWAENQVMAALKAVPLGQASGQRLLAELGDKIPAVALAALDLPESAWSNFTPAFAIACARHETQYSRLFRS